MDNLTFLSPKTKKRNSAVHGRGLFAREAISQDEPIAVKGGYITTTEHWAELEPKVGLAAEIHVANGLVIAPRSADEYEGAMMHLNHACDPKEADVESWPGAIARLQERYPEVRLVLPGHGELGGRDLVNHTRELLSC